MRFLNAIGFLTIIKIPSRFYIKKEDYHKTLIFFPAVGLFIGLMGALLFLSLNFIFPVILICMILAGFEVIITGAIHIDGLADTFDGAFSGETNKAKILRIMKKGDTGVFGVIAIILSLAFRVVFYYLISTRLATSSFFVFENGFRITGEKFLTGIGGFLVLASIIVFTPVFGRLSMLYLFSRYEPAVKQGSLVNIFKHSSNRFDFAITFIFSSIFFLFISLLTKINLMVSPGSYKTGIFRHLGSNSALAISTQAILYAAIAAVVIVLTMLFAAGAGKYFTRKIGGLSGDIIGAVCLLSEVLFLFLNYVAIIFL